MIRTGRSKAAEKLNPTHPDPRFPGSERGPRAPTTPGYPIEMASYVQPSASSCTAATIWVGVKRLPDRQVRGSVSPVARIFTFEPPMSMTRIVVGGVWLSVAVIVTPVRSLACASDLLGECPPCCSLYHRGAP